MKTVFRKIAIRLALVIFGRGVASCREANRLGSESRDRRLSLYERLSLGVHNRLCRDCARYAEQVEAVCECAKRGRETPPLPECTKKRLADALRAADAGGASGPGRGPGER